jgi:adenylosuccinate synthase
MPVLSVIGTQWGDEGKGKILDLIAERADVVVRYQGGANAGHTVVVGQEKFVFHLLLRDPARGQKNVIASASCSTRASCSRRSTAFEKRGIKIQGRLFVSAAAHLVFRTTRRSTAPRRGEGRHEDRHDGPRHRPRLRRQDRPHGAACRRPLRSARFAERVRANVAEKNKILQALYRAEPLSADAILDEFRGYATRLQPYVVDSFHLLRDCLDAGSTSSSKGPRGSCSTSTSAPTPSSPRATPRALGISAAPASRRSASARCSASRRPTARASARGRSPRAPAREAEVLRKRGEEFGATTGRPRRCGWFDGVATASRSR